MRQLLLSSLLLSLVACGTVQTDGSDASATQSGGYTFGSTGSGSSSSGSDDTGDDADSGDDTDDADPGSTDTGCVATAWYADNDVDGLGSMEKDDEGNYLYSVSACSQPTGYVSNSTDLDDGLAVVGATATPAKICGVVDISHQFSFWWNDMWLDESNNWGSETVTDVYYVCEEVNDFRPTHPFEINGYYKGDGGEDEWLVGAGNTSHLTELYVFFNNGTFDIYLVDSTGTHTGAGYAYFVNNGDGGGNLNFYAASDYNGNYTYSGSYASL